MILLQFTRKTLRDLTCILLKLWKEFFSLVEYCKKDTEVTDIFRALGHLPYQHTRHWSLLQQPWLSDSPGKAGRLLSLLGRCP